MNRLSCRICATLAGLLAAPAAAIACLWDYDTLKQERARFPSALELITGKFLRHSQEFYEWRIQDRLKKIAADPKNPALHDDLAAAYDKTGQHDKAIETMRKVEAFAPGRYETYANLGTFYFHSGKLEEGLPYIDKALAINPDAHFGRERYQKWLVEYILERTKITGKLQLPLGSEEIDGLEPRTFSYFLYRQHPELFDEHQALFQREQEAAVKGILGMMRFGKHDSAILLNVLADLLSSAEGLGRSVDAKLLAARAYLKASYEVKEPDARRKYRDLAEGILLMRSHGPTDDRQVTLGEVEAEFARELQDAAAWYEDLRNKELQGIQGGADPEAEFDRLYTVDPSVSGEVAASDEYPGNPRDRMLDPIKLAVQIGGGLLALLVGVFVVWLFVKLIRGESESRSSS
jgi:tetratricopeptide (TPR) repeat protein